MRKMLILFIFILVVQGCTVLDNSGKKFEKEFKSYDKVEIYRESDDLHVWKQKDDEMAHWKKGEEEGSVSAGVLLDYLLNVLSK